MTAQFSAFPRPPRAPRLHPSAITAMLLLPIPSTYHLAYRAVLGRCKPAHQRAKALDVPGRTMYAYVFTTPHWMSRYTLNQTDATKNQQQQREKRQQQRPYTTCLWASAGRLSS